MDQAPQQARQSRKADTDRRPRYEPIGHPAEVGNSVDETAIKTCPYCQVGKRNGRLPVCGGPVRLLNATLCPVTQRQSVDIVVDALRRQQGGWIVTPNLDHVRRCSEDSHYATTVRKANLRLADGMPLVWASRLKRTPLPERVAGSDLIYSLSKGLGEEGKSVFLLGGEPGTADAAGKVLKARYPKLVIAGAHCPPVGFEHDPKEMKKIEDQLRATRPDLVFVALGSPKQEYLVETLRDRFPTTWWIGVGISFSFVCGRVKRAPKWMQRCGLEWMHRLTQEPRRLAKRYLFHGLPFAAHLLIRSGLRR